MSKIKDIIEENEREFEELVDEKRGILARAGHILIPILFTETEVKSHLHQFQLKLLEGVRAEIMKLKVFTGGSSVNEKDKRIIRQDIINLLSLPETNK